MSDHRNAGRIGDAAWQDRMLAYTVECMRIIEEHGWMVQGVGAGFSTPQFAYTAGRAGKGLAELCISGLGFETMQAILNDLASRERDFTHGEVLDDVLDGYDVTIVAATPDEDGIWPGTAYRLYPHETVRLQQVVFPDKAGRFPWQDGYSLGDAQTVAGRP